jgi:hypothetical protein
LRLADGKAHARIWRKGHDAVAAWQKLDREPAVCVRRCAGDYGAAGGGLDGNDRSATGRLLGTPNGATVKSGLITAAPSIPEFIVGRLGGTIWLPASAIVNVRASAGSDCRAME